MKKFNLREGNLEVRSCDKHHVTTSEEHDRAEIVAWSENDEYYYTIARFIPTSDGFDLQFVGNRPFDVSWYDFMVIAKTGYRLLTEDNEEEH